MPTLAGVEIHVDTERPSYSVQAMSHPMEDGLPVTDHIQRQPIGFSLDGLVLNPGASEKRDRLLAAMNSGELVVYLGRNSAYTMLIMSLDPVHDYKVANGFRYSIKLLEARIVNVAQDVPPETDPTGTATSETGNLGTQQLEQTTDQVDATIKEGDTFWALAKTFKTTVDAIASLNPDLDPRRLQIGEKVRVV